MNDEIKTFKAIRAALDEAIICLSPVHFEMHRMDNKELARAYKALLTASLNLEPPVIANENKP